ncbi:phosphonate C-P lyase system protein PhnG [Rhodovulum sp. DZ06]|uniref:phosphonate C-P lyase system protein PhnG n=1 Tax=Rhodovulum sp. DZ06 TaxID=3425126 RepID=UPI003D353CDD
MNEPVQPQGAPENPSSAEAHPDPARAARMSVLAKADPAALAAAMEALPSRPGFTWLRRPERGAVMVRGRAGGTGAPFNLGEMTVTRCTLQTEDGAVGHAWVPGRDATHAEAAALADAMAQTDAGPQVEAHVLAPLREAAEAAAAARAGKADATKVEFFTMVRGDD